MASDPGDSPARTLPGPPSPRPGFVPGGKKARHQRFTKAVTWFTLAGVLAFLGFAAWGVVALLSRPSPSEKEILDCQTTLRGLADDIRAFRAVRNRLPATLAELRAPDLISRTEAQPRDRWDRPVEYKAVDESKGEFRLRSLGPDGKPDTSDDLLWPTGKAWN